MEGRTVGFVDGGENGGVWPWPQRGLTSTASSACVVVQYLTTMYVLHTTYVCAGYLNSGFDSIISVVCIPQPLCCLSSMILAPLVVLMVEDPADAALPNTYKFRCSSEAVARKVTQLINFAKTVHEYEKTVVQSYRRQMKNIW